MKQDDASKRREIVKYVVIIWAMIAVVAVLYVLFLNILHAGKIDTAVKCAPYTAMIFVDKSPVENNTNMYLKEGKHEVMCFLPGFEISEEKIDISKDNNGIMIELISNTKEGERIAEAHINDYYDVESFVGKMKGTGLESYSEKEQKLLTFLPYNVDNFGIGTYKNEGEAIITITTWKPGYIQMAVNKLLELAEEANVSLAGYDFRINNFNNVMDNFHDNSNNNLENYIKNGLVDYNYEFRGNGEIDKYHYVLIAINQNNDGKVVYRCLFERVDGLWKMVAKPYPILNVYNTPEVSEEILEVVNKTQIEMINNE